jgi:DNA-binding NarL/FixJ family response regulator
VGSVERALDRLDAHGTDLIVTDLLMPGAGGLELLQALRVRRRSTPVIVMTGSDDDLLIRRARELGAHTVLGKHVAPDLLGLVIRRALDHATEATGTAA